MKKRSRIRQNLQSRAFYLFNKGWNALMVSEELRITISEARSYLLIFRQSEYLSPDKKKDITEFLEDGYRLDRERSVADLFCNLPEIRKRISEADKIGKISHSEVARRMNLIRRFDEGIAEALFFFPDIEKSFHWIPEGDSAFIDRLGKLCFN